MSAPNGRSVPCTVVAPGVVRAENVRNRLIIGHPDGTTVPWLDTLAPLLKPTGIEVSVTAKIRDPIWGKLVINLVGGSLATLSASPMRDVLNKPTIAGTANTTRMCRRSLSGCAKMTSGRPATGEHANAQVPDRLRHGGIEAVMDYRSGFWLAADGAERGCLFFPKR
ncbi:hypothetical protein VUN82_10600 [Micrococcaceae bacterium Sec5.1]